VVIDLPQVVEMEHNADAQALLRRDVESLCSSFERFGIRPDPRRVLRDVHDIAEGAAYRGPT
jgi:serine/threonine-protein kinase RIO1